MLKTFKDVRRRVVETVLEGVGASEKTVDEEFENHHHHFKLMLDDLNECGAGLQKVLSGQKTLFIENEEMSKSYARVHSNFDDPEFWVGIRNNMKSADAAKAYNEKIERIHNVYRSSCALVNFERGLEPMREAIAKYGPEIEAITKDRNTQLIDFDSYKRRLKSLREKKDQLEAAGKGNTNAAQDNMADISKFETKEEAAKKLYLETNAQAKKDIIEAKAVHDEIMNECIAATIICQAEFYARAAAELKLVVDMLPPALVQAVKAQIEKTIQDGGASQEKAEKTKIQKGIAIATGKNVPSDFKKKDGANPPPPASAPSAPPAPTGPSPNKSNAGANPFASGGNPFTADDMPVAKQVGGVPPPPPPAGRPASSTPATVTVTALYDHDAEAEDELSFKTGDSIEVLESNDDGWWQGRCHGKVGLFPVNYVQQ